MSNKNWRFETKQLHVGQEQADPVTDSRAVPIYASTSFVFHNSQHAADRFGLRDAGNIYGRLTNPTEDVFEKRIAALEGGTAALAVASGAAAVSYALQALAKAGDNIVAAKTIYGGTYNWLEHTISEISAQSSLILTKKTHLKMQLTKTQRLFSLNHSVTPIQILLILKKWQTLLIHTRFRL